MKNKLLIQMGLESERTLVELDSMISRQSLQACEVKPMQKCLKHAFFLPAGRGKRHWLQ